MLTFGKTRGKYGHKEYTDPLPYIAVRKSIPMDLNLFMDMTREITFDHYPREAASLGIEFDEYGRVVTGPVVWTADTGPR